MVYCDRSHRRRDRSAILGKHIWILFLRQISQIIRSVRHIHRNIERYRCLRASGWWFPRYCHTYCQAQMFSQVNKLGIPRAESSGQPYYPIYLFGTYKLACVIVGCAIALVWTIFPYPLSSGSQARKVLGRSLFVLANFYSCIHTTIHLWITRSPQEDPPVSRALNVAQDKLFADEMRLLALLRVHTHFTKFNPRLGGKFPASIYRSIIADIRTILISMALMVQSTRGMNGPSAQRELEWLPKLSQAIESTSFNSQTTTSLLCHFSAAVANELALPPYLSPPASFGIAREVRKLNLGLLDVSNADNPFFSAFASLEVLNALMSASLTRLARYGRYAFNIGCQFANKVQQCQAPGRRNLL
ncbi:hypothetical protein HRR87_007590 [Exophiala dermatitidis]|nr:hypothetical protein HRR87_007590 [Exophiala dermatitidis]